MCAAGSGAGVDTEKIDGRLGDFGLSERPFRERGGAEVKFSDRMLLGCLDSS